MLLGGQSKRARPFHNPGTEGPLIAKDLSSDVKIAGKISDLFFCLALVVLPES